MPGKTLWCSPFPLLLERWAEDLPRGGEPCVSGRRARVMGTSLCPWWGWEHGGQGQKQWGRSSPQMVGGGGFMRALIRILSCLCSAPLPPPHLAPALLRLPHLPLAPLRPASSSPCSPLSCPIFPRPAPSSLCLAVPLPPLCCPIFPLTPSALPRCPPAPLRPAPSSVHLALPPPRPRLPSALPCLLLAWLWPQLRRGVCLGAPRAPEEVPAGQEPGGLLGRGAHLP